MSDCGICLGPIEKERTLKCGHKFCHTCLHEWFKRERSCPSCRRNNSLTSSTSENEHEKKPCITGRVVTRFLALMFLIIPIVPLMFAAQGYNEEATATTSFIFYCAIMGVLIMWCIGALCLGCELEV